MEKTSFKINILKNYSETSVKPLDYDNVIYVEKGDELYTVSQIVLSGKYSKTYCVLTDFVALHDDIVLVDGDKLFICAYNEIAVIDLNRDVVVKIINYKGSQLFGIYKFKSGYFVHGEETNMFLNIDLECVWEIGCIDIFVNTKAENDFELHDDYIAVFDWYGYKHFYNETGEFKTEDHPEYSMSGRDSF